MSGEVAIELELPPLPGSVALDELVGVRSEAEIKAVEKAKRKISTEVITARGETRPKREDKSENEEESWLLSLFKCTPPPAQGISYVFSLIC